MNGPSFKDAGEAEAVLLSGMRSPKIEFESEQRIGPNLVTFRYHCGRWAYSITSIEIPARRAASGE